MGCRDIDGKMDGWKDGKEWMECNGMERWMDGCMEWNGWNVMNGWNGMEGWMRGMEWMDGWNGMEWKDG
jgi:hypothetical protein